MKFSSSAIIEFISYSHLKQFQIGYLGIDCPALVKYSQNPQSFRFTSMFFCLLGITAISFLTLQGNVFLPWLSSERWEWKLKDSFSQVLKNLSIYTSISPIQGQSLMWFLAFSQTFCENSCRQCSILQQPYGLSALFILSKLQQNSNSLIRLHIILIYKKPFSLTLSSVIPLYTFETSLIMYTSFSIYSDTYRFFFSIYTNILDNFTSSFSIPSLRKLNNPSITTPPIDRLKERRVFAGYIGAGIFCVGWPEVLMYQPKISPKQKIFYFKQFFTQNYKNVRINYSEIIYLCPITKIIDNKKVFASDEFPVLYIKLPALAHKNFRPLQEATIPSRPTRLICLSSHVFLPDFLNLRGQNDSQNLLILDLIQEREKTVMQSQRVIQSNYIQINPYYTKNIIYTSLCSRRDRTIICVGVVWPFAAPAPSQSASTTPPTTNASPQLNFRYCLDWLIGFAFCNQLCQFIPLLPSQ